MSNPAATTSWEPLAEGLLAERLTETLEAIAAELPRSLPHAGLGGGESGLALFYGHLAQARPGQGWEERCGAHLAQAADLLVNEVSGPSFYAGFAGVAWAMDRLQQPGADPGAEDGNEEIDEALEGLLEGGPWRGDYDLISGLVGYGLYGLDRLERPSGRRILQRVVEHLDDLKVEADGGFTWHTPPRLLPTWQREQHPEGYYNLGLAHGVPSVIALLGQAHAAGLHPARSLALLEGAVAWLLAQRRPDGDGSCFAGVVPCGAGPEVGPSRLAWCYGDLGLSIALLWAAGAADRPDWAGEALAVARAAAQRDAAQSGVRDAGLCHGAAGNAHLFNRLWQATGDPLFRTAALGWLEDTLARRTPGHGIAGFRAWMPGSVDPDSDPWEDEPGFLEGAAGIGLALASALYPVPPDWDRMLLTALPPLGGRK